MNETTERHILVVDDDILTACALKEHLELQGYHVTVAENSKEGQLALRSPARIDLVILDHLMPDGFGTELLQAIAEQEDLQKPPVIMSSFVADPQSAAWESLRKRLPALAQALIKAYVNKPYSLSMMDAVINLLLSASTTKRAANEPVTSGDYEFQTPLQKIEESEIKFPL